jgi:hypothetical protein
MFKHKTSNAASFWWLITQKSWRPMCRVIIFRIVVLAHQRRPQVAFSKFLQLALRFIQFKALELLDTQIFAGTVDLMLEAVQVLCRNCLGGSVVHLHVSKHSCRKLLHSDNSLPVTAPRTSSVPCRQQLPSCPSRSPHYPACSSQDMI